MNYRTLGRTFRRILLVSVPLPAAAVAACSSSTSDGQSANGAHGDRDATNSGGVANSGGAANSGDATNSGGLANSGGAANSGGLTNAGGAVAGDAGTFVTSCGERIALTTGPFGTQRCHADCFPLEAGAFNADAAAVAQGPTGLCAALCGNTTGWFSCSPTLVAGVSMIRCQPDCTGRRPEGLLPSEAAMGPPLGAYFSEMARLEAASVHAFRRLRAELAAHGAPRLLVRAAERAARDEVRHARTARALARRHGGTRREPVVRHCPPRDIEAIATENAVEGCVRETFGALIATRQAQTAKDPAVRAAMSRIARDETRHAALAHAVDAWIGGRLNRAARARVGVARERAAEALLADASEPTAAFRAALGLPTAAEARALAARMTAELS